MARIAVRTAAIAAAVALFTGASSASAAAAQVPLSDISFASPAAAAAVPVGPDGGSTLALAPAARLNFSSPAPHLFASAYGLLQQWSNTIFPNGYAVAACTLPAYTLLYHGRQEEEEEEATPASPEWLALDVEMAYGIMGASRHSWLLTYQTTRSVRLLYFDGESATLMGLGQLDSQMLMLYGNVTGPPAVPGSGGFAIMADEYARARGLCDWLDRTGLRGHGWGYEGVVRMNAGFEIIWCDFLSDSLRLLSRLNVTAPLDREGGAAEEGVFEDVSENVSEGADDTADDAAETDDAETDDAEKPIAPRGSYYSLPPVPTRTDRVADPSAPPAPPNWRRPGSSGGREPFLEAQGWGWFESATWHYGSTRAGPGAGETRLRIDSCAIFSFYAPQFVGGPLALARAEEEQHALNLTADGYWDWDWDWDGKSSEGDRTRALGQLARRRRFHHLGDASEGEAVAMRQRIEQSLAGQLQLQQDRRAVDGQRACSGADWTLILAEIVQRVAVHLKTMEKLLGDGPRSTTMATGAAITSTPASASASANATREWLHQLRAQSHMFMVGYLEYPTQAKTSGWQPHSALFNRTLALCRYRYTRLLVPDDGDETLPSKLSSEESDIRWAVEETYGTLCTELLTIGFDIERVWAERYGSSAGAGKARKSRLPSMSIPRIRWADRLAELIAWLGWEGEFLGCSRVCDWDERCFIPMWPMLNSQWGRGDGPGGGHGGPRGPGGHDGPRGPEGPEGPEGPGGPGVGYGRPGEGGLDGGGRRRRPGDGEHGPGGSPRWPPSQNGSYGPPGFGFPRTPAMMGNETDLWEPKCVKAWYANR